MRAPITDDVKRVARAMLKEFDDLMGRIVNEVWASVPAYAELVLQRSELRERIRENVHNVIVCLVEDREPTPDELARAAMTGERRALQGVSSSAVIQSFRTAERALNVEYFDWCGRMQVRPSNIGVGRSALIRCLDSLENAMLEAHLEIQRQVENEQRLSEPALFRRLVDGANVDISDIERLAVTMGIDDPEQSGFVIVGVSSGGPTDRTAMELHRHHVVGRMRQLFAVPMLSGTVVTDAGGAIILFALPWEAPLDLLAQRVASVLRNQSVDLRGSVSDPCLGLAGLGTASRQALVTLEAHGTRERVPPVALFRDSLLEVLVHRDATTARQLVQRYLPQLHGGDLLTTLKAHLDHDLSVRATSEFLHVHKNTVVYRLRRIEEITGLSLRRPRDLTRLVLAVEALETAALSR